MPSPVAQVMNFYEALKRVLDGECVSRAAWGDKQVYLTLGEFPDKTGDRLLAIHNTDGALSPLLVCEPDITATDWIVVYPRG